MFSIVNKLDGYKTIIGGIAFLLLGSIALVAYFIPSLQSPLLEKAMDFFAWGFTALGLGGKLDKLKTGLDKSIIISKGEA